MEAKTELLDEGVIHINKAELDISVVHKPRINKPVVGFAFYISGNGQIEINTSGQKLSLNKEPRQSSSFFVDPSSCEIRQTYPSNQRLHKISILITRSYLEQLFPEASEDKSDYFHKLIRPDSSYIDNTSVKVSSNILRNLHDLSDNRYQGRIRSIWVQGKVLELISSHLELLEAKDQTDIGLPRSDIQKIEEAEKIISNSFLDPPSLDSLAKSTNLNTLKLKKGFKKRYGKPVFTYLRDKRLKKAHRLLENGQLNVTQAAYAVGYSSIGSFSNAFQDQFGYRPSDIL